MFGDNSSRLEDIIEQLSGDIPVLPLRNAVAYPMSVLPIVVSTPRAMRLVQDAIEHNQAIALVTSYDEKIADPMPDEIYPVGSLAVIQRAIAGEDDTMRLVVETMERVRITDWAGSEPYLSAHIELAPETEERDTESEALNRGLMNISREIIQLMPGVPDQVVESLAQIRSNRILSYTIAANARMSIEKRVEVLDLDSVNAKMRVLLEVLTKEKEVLAIGQEITEQTREQVNKEQREFFLRRQMESIRKELGDIDDEAAEAENYRQKIEDAGLPKEAYEQAMRELKRLERLSAQSAEYGVIRTYLDWLVELPWNTSTEDNLDINHARQVLDDDHYGLKDIKDRILEFLAIRKLAADRAHEKAEGEVAEGAGVILLFVGPPGVGKTSLGQSIARSLGREFTRMSLGGMRDESEIRGHRRTYIGAMPGRIVQAIKRAETRNPVFMLDEVDKIGSDWRGDPASALLEVLDPQQNNAFRDHYLDVDFDLSDVIFIATANQLDTIPRPLLDRMEVIQLDGYTEYEKINIAQGHLVGRQLRANSLRSDEISFTDDALRKLIREYTREAGVRNLERQIGAVMRKLAVDIASGEKEHIEVTAEMVRDVMGKPRFRFEVPQRWEIPGVATGLAWTPVGGDVLFIEATRSQGKGQLTITGQLGKVMEESVRIAYSYLRSHAQELGIDESVFDSSDFHIHVPEGAVPKDGPSAGITMTTALYSLLIGQPVRGDVAMTGEITLRGQVLPIGGVKMKALAARRAGITTVLLPEHNMEDLEDIPDEVLNEINFVSVKNINDVLANAIEPVQIHHETSFVRQDESVMA